MNSLNVSVSCEVTWGCLASQSSQGWVFEEEPRHRLSVLTLLESSGKQTNSNHGGCTEEERMVSPIKRPGAPQLWRWHKMWAYSVDSPGTSTWVDTTPGPAETTNMHCLRQELVHLKCHFLQKSAFESNTKAARVKGDLESAASLYITSVLRVLRKGLVRNNFWKTAELCCWCCTLLRAHYSDITTTKFTDVFQQPGKRTLHLSPVPHSPDKSQSTVHRLRRRSHS